MGIVSVLGACSHVHAHVFRPSELHEERVTYVLKQRDHLGLNRVQW
jgi:hypothetical protein